MKKISQLLSAVLLTSAMILPACQNKDKDPQPPTKGELLAGSSSKKWKITALTVVLKNSTSSIVYTADLLNPADSLIVKPLEACEKDNLAIFFSNKKYLTDNGSVKCSSTEPQTLAEGTWGFNADQTILITSAKDPISMQTVTQESTIKELSATTLKLEIFTSDTFDNNGTTVVSEMTVKYTFTAQ